MKEFEIRLENLKFYSFHGVYNHETRDGNEFGVDLLVKYKTSTNRYMLTDTLNYTISYADLYSIVKREMETPKKLMETVAVEICNKIKENFPFCLLIECKITKFNPPIPSFIGSASVTFRLTN